jgi:hypothetical protein
MEFKIMIFPGMLFKAVIRTCDNVLADLRTEGKYPVADRRHEHQGGFARIGAKNGSAYANASAIRR